MTITRVLFMLVAMMCFAAVAPGEAQAQPTPGGDIFSCGGRGEPACPAFSQFWQNGNFGCDRGLKEVGGICVNHTRRQGAGRQFRQSELGRKLDMQRRLNWHRPIGLQSDISVHNAYENHADGYPAGSQRYSITEMLDAGFRQIELDVWTDTLKLGYPKLCHGACSANDRFFSSAIKELRDWLKEPENRLEVVIVLFDGYGFDSTQVALVDASIKAYLADDPAIGVYTGESRWQDGSNPPMTDTPWPSPAQMVANGTRVLFVIQQDSVGQYLKKERWGSVALTQGDNGGIKPTEVVGYPTCELRIEKENKVVTSIDISPDGQFAAAWMMKEVYPSAFQPTAAQLRDLMSCGVDSVKMNYLLQTSAQDANSDDPARLESAVWSWAPGEPSRTTPGTAAYIAKITGTGGSFVAPWFAHDPSDVAPYLCNNPAADPLVRLRVVGSGPWYQGFAVCAAAGLEFYAPRNGYETAQAVAAISGTGAWIAVQTHGGLDGFNVRTGTSAIAVWDLGSFGGAFEGTPVLLSILPGQTVTSVEWSFGDGAVLTKPGDNVFPNVVQHTWALPGSYTVTAKLSVDGAVIETLTRTIEIKQLSDVAFGPRITLDADSLPGEIVEGASIRPSFSARWPITGVQCGTGAAVSAPTLLVTRPDPVDLSTTIYTATFDCVVPGGSSPTTRLTAFGAVPDPSTGLPAIDPATGQTATLSKYYTLPVRDARAPAITTGNATVTYGQVLYHTLEFDELEGEPLTVKVKWPNAPIEGTYTTSAGLLTLAWRAQASLGAHTVRVTVTDGETAIQTGTFTVTVEPGQPTEITAMEGPARPVVGQAVNYYFTALAPPGGTLVPSASSCGARGTRIAGPSAFQPNPDGSQMFGIRCLFTRRGPSEVAMTFQSNASTIVTARQYVRAYVDGAPDDIRLTGPAKPTVGTKVNYYFDVMASDDGGVTVVGASCGTQGAVTAGPTWLGTDPADGTRAYGVQCLFGMPGSSVVSMTFRGDNGDEVTYTQTVNVGGVADVPPVVKATDGPAVPAPHVDATYTFTVWDASKVTASTPSCGTGEVVSGPTFVGFGDDASRLFSVVCRFSTTGETTVSMTFTDADGGATTTGTIPVVVRVALPAITAADVTVAATGARTPATYAVTALNATSLTCNPAEGSTFPVGVTSVMCTAVNDGGEASATFVVTVVDNVAPRLSLEAPAIIEATGPHGAAVVYAASALDAVDGTIVPSCSVVPGTMVAVGASQVIECTATDASQNRSHASLTVSVRDSTAPVIAPVPPVVVTAAGPEGATVTYPPPSTTDVVDGLRDAVCAPASGTVFAVGITQVTCTATDTAGNAATPLTFSVTVTAVPVPTPVIEGPRAVTVEATGPNGAVARFQVTARDSVDRRVPVVCTPASGSVFPLGTTLVTCTARNTRGGSATHEIQVTVRDTEAPRLTTPARQRVEATRPEGAVVTFQASAQDRVDGAVAVACAPASGSVFPLGRTTVRCSARDRQGNERAAEFEVAVRDTGAPDILSLTPSVTTLPASGASVPVTIAVEVVDVVDPAPVCTITSVVGAGRDLDRDGERDWAVTGPLSLTLEAATRKHRDRTYRITVKCVDAAGNASREMTAVVVSRMP